MLVWQDGHLVWIVPLQCLSVLEVGRDAVLDVVLELIVALVELFLLARLIADLDRQALLLAVLVRQVVRALPDTALGRLVQRL